MSKQKPQEQRERLSHEEQKRNPTGNVNDSINHTQSGMPNTSGMGWKEISGVILLLLVILVVYSLYTVFFG